MKQIPKYTVLLLDVDGTLLDFRPCSAMALEKAAASLGVTLPPSAGEDFRRLNAALWQRLEGGEFDRGHLYGIRFDLLSEQWGIPFDGKRFDAAFQSALGETHVPMEGAADLLSYLHGEYTLCVASNANSDFQCGRLRRAGFLGYFSHIFCSDRPGEDKPNARFFENCLSALPGTDRRQVLMIGDSPTADVEGAEGAGIDTCWIDPGHIPFSFVHPPHYRVESLAELKEML